jgi:hypothetical protein
MALPNVTINLSNGNLGRLPANQDGVAGHVFGPTAVAPASATLNTAYLIRTLADAEALGITEAYDVANDVIVWHHLKEFYEECGGTSELYIILFNGTMAAQFDVDGPADKLMQASAGDIRLVGSAYTPAVGAVADTDGLATGVIAAIATAKAFVIRQFTAHKPCRVLLEGYAIESVAALAYDLRDTTGPVADPVGVVVGQTAGLLPSSMSDFTRYASIGRVMGRAARIAVHYNLGRVKDGPLVGVVSGGFSDASALAAATDAQLEALNTLGYIFFRVHSGLAGLFINDDHMATPITSDYSGLARGRVIDKAARIAYRVYVNELNDDVELDGTTGQLALATVKNLESIIETAIGSEMAGEITSVDAYIDPVQNILSTDQINVELNIVPRGIARNIRVTLAYRNPAAATA